MINKCFLDFLLHIDGAEGKCYDKIPKGGRRMELIDAHVHIVPRGLLGTRDERFGLTVEPFGLKCGGVERIRFLPAYMEDSAFSSKALLALLDDSGVSRAVIQQSFCHYDNEAVAEAVAAAPDRLSGAMVLEPRDEGCLADMEYWASRGLRSLKFETSRGLGYTHPKAYPALRFDTPLFDRLFERAAALGLTVTIDPGRPGDQCHDPAMLERAVSAHPGTRFVLCHLGFPAPEMTEEREALWQRMIALARFDNVYFDAAAMPDLFAAEGCPWPGAMARLRAFLDLYPGKALWGSDVPGTLCNAAYPQMIEAFRRSPLFTEKELKALFAETAKKAYAF